MGWLLYLKTWFNKYPLMTKAAFLGAFVLFFIVLGFLFSKCGGSDKPSVTLEEVEKINSVNEKEKREALSNVIKKQDETRQVDQVKIDQLSNKVEEIKQEKKRDVTAEELEQLAKEYK
jgi:hypothetical protein